MGGEIGWGRFALERLAGDELVVTVEGSPFAEAYGPAAGPVNNHSKEDVMESLWFGMIFVTLCVVMVILAVVDNQG